MTRAPDETRAALDDQLRDFASRRFLAMPLAGLVVWTAIGVAGAVLPPYPAVISLFIGTGLIVYLGMFISRFTGENFFARARPRNQFDVLFLLTVGMSLLVFSIAIPFFLVDYTSLPLSVGVLAGLMWMPMSWLIRHWIGIAHAVARTALIVAAWYAWPESRFVAIPFLIVAVYVVTIVVLEARWRRLRVAGPGG